MAKRFTSTEIWGEDWFITMPTEYKLFWYYMLSACNHAGIFKVNVNVFRIIHSLEVTPQLALKYFNEGKDRIRILNPTLWLIEDFFSFQYGTIFNERNRVHESIKKELEKNGVKLTSIRGLSDLKETPMDKDSLRGIVKGESYEEEKTIVRYTDGTSRKLSKMQQIEAKSMPASYFVKGKNY